jgi:hypothetical protein
MSVGGTKVLARKIEKNTKTKKSYKEKPKERTEKMAEGLQKELDALVPPISVKKERDIDERIKARAEKGAEENLSEVPLEKRSTALEKPIRKEQVRPSKRKVNPWGIVIGETD